MNTARREPRTEAEKMARKWAESRKLARMAAYYAEIARRIAAHEVRS